MSTLAIIALSMGGVGFVLLVTGLAMIMFYDSGLSFRRSIIGSFIWSLGLALVIGSFIVAPGSGTVFTGEEEEEVIIPVVNTGDPTACRMEVRWESPMGSPPEAYISVRCPVEAP